MARGDEHLAAEVAALLFAGELVLEVDARSTGLDHALHELEGVEGSPEARLGVGDDGQEPVTGNATLAVLDLVRPLEGVVETLHQGGHRVGGVEALVRVGLARGVGIRRHLPAGAVDGLQAGLGHLNGLAAGHGAEGPGRVLLLEELPELPGPEGGQGVLDAEAAPELLHRVGAVGSGDALPAAGGEIVFEGGDGETGGHGAPHVGWGWRYVKH